MMMAAIAAAALTASAPPASDWWFIGATASRVTFYDKSSFKKSTDQNKGYASVTSYTRNFSTKSDGSNAESIDFIFNCTDKTYTMSAISDMKDSAVIKKTTFDKSYMTYEPPVKGTIVADGMLFSCNAEKAAADKTLFIDNQLFFRVPDIEPVIAYVRDGVSKPVTSAPTKAD